MSEINKALENLVDAYLARGKHQDAVRAKYAQFERDLAAARQRDIDEVAEALLAAWQAGATVAATGQAMGTTNIYAARKAYYSRARVLQGEQSAEEGDFLQRLYQRAKGSIERGLEQSAAGETVDLGDFSKYAEWDDSEVLRNWVSSWTLEETGPNNYTVNDPQERVDKIINGMIFGFRDKNATEFREDAELHALVAEVHGIDTKEFN